MVRSAADGPSDLPHHILLMVSDGVMEFTAINTRVEAIDAEIKALASTGPDRQSMMEDFSAGPSIASTFMAAVRTVSSFAVGRRLSRILCAKGRFR